MELVELFVAVLLVGISAVNASLPIVAWSRSRDGRFLLLAGASGGLATLGAIWTWGALPVSPPAFAGVELPVLLVALAVSALLLGATVWPRHL